MSGGYNPTTLAETLRDMDGPTQGNAARWPDAPDPRTDEDGRVTNAEVAECPACGDPSTLCYRCSECGKDLAAVGTRDTEKHSEVGA